MPRIISSNGQSNIEAIKKYFCSEYVVKRIADITGMNYDTLIGGDYKLLLEPVAYFTFQGVMVATTATEAALYDQKVNGLLRSWMQSLTHKNLPLAMFLKHPILGILHGAAPERPLHQTRISSRRWDLVLCVSKTPNPNPSK